MALTHCGACESTEGGWRVLTAKEIYDHGWSEDDQRLVCLECGEVGSKESIPEHDDFDMER